jgi:hypothetical protein
MSLNPLLSRTKRELARMARDRGVVGWHAMRKDELIQVLAARLEIDSESDTLMDLPRLPSSSGSPAPVAAKAQAHGRGSGGGPVSAPRNGATAAASSPSSNTTSSASPTPVNRIFGTTSHATPEATSPHTSPSRLAAPTNRTPPVTAERDRVITVVRDPYWLHSYWELSRATLERAKAAMGRDWHSSKPILRLMDLTSEDTTAASEKPLRDIEIHGEVNNWYIDVPAPPRSFRVDLGYLARSGRFYVLARSNIVTTPKARMCDQPHRHGRRLGLPTPQELDGDGYPAAMPREFRDALESQRRQQQFSFQGLGTGALPTFGRDFHFEVDAELVVYGVTEPNAKVTLHGEPVKVQPDGTFSVRFSLPDSRQIIPAVAASSDGVEERTIVLAVERNTKALEPMIHDGNDL